MNWKHIKNKYPKAFDLFTDKDLILLRYIKQENDNFCQPDSPTEYTKAGLIHTNDLYDEDVRSLYDFFDEQKIYISVHIQDETVPLDELDRFGVDIFNDKGLDTFCLDNFLSRTRKEAEEVAFTKAFELLEEKLK